MAEEDIGTLGRRIIVCMIAALHVLNVGALAAYAVWVATVTDGETDQWVRFFYGSLLYILALVSYWNTRYHGLTIWGDQFSRLADKEHFWSLSSEAQEWVIRGNRSYLLWFSLPHIACFWWANYWLLLSKDAQRVSWLPAILPLCMLGVVMFALRPRLRHKLRKRLAEAVERERGEVVDSFS